MAIIFFEESAKPSMMLQVIHPIHDIPLPSGPQFQSFDFRRWPTVFEMHVHVHERCQVAVVFGPRRNLGPYSVPRFSRSKEPFFRTKRRWLEGDVGEGR